MKKETEEVAKGSTGKELRHYYCHECNIHHEKGSTVWLEHHPKLRKLTEVEDGHKPIKDATDKTGE